MERMRLLTIAIVSLGCMVGACSLDTGDNIDDGDIGELQGGLQKSQGGTNFDWDYCSPPYGSPLCLEGEGDCDSDADCEPGLVCGQNNGWRYGAPASMDVCWDPSCNENTCGGVCPPCSCAGSPGDADYCNSSCQCDAGEGDCDADSDCAPGLVCGTDNGAQFGLKPSLDVCWSATCESRTLFAYDYCSVDCPCLAGEGDCDLQPGQCAPGLVCGIDIGRRFGTTAMNDICWPAICETRSLWDWSYCTPDCPCDVGMGDCDKDADCGPGLVCAQNVGASYGRHPTMDVCEAAP